MRLVRAVVCVLAALPGFAGEVIANRATAVDAQGFLYKLNTAHDGSILVTKVNPDSGEIFYRATLSGSRTAHSIAVDVDGSVLIAGSQDRSAFVAKLDPKGREWVFDRSLASGSDAIAVAAGPLGTVLVTGWTDSSDFPVTRAAQQVRTGERDAFVVKLDSRGEILFGTFIGGGSSTEGAGIGVDRNGDIFVAGTIRGRSAMPGLLPGGRDGGEAFLLKLSGDGSERIRAEVFAGSVSSLAVAPDGSAFVAGSTSEREGFVAKFGPQGEKLFVTALEAPASAIALDSGGNSYVAGHSYLAKLSPDGKRILMKKSSEPPTLAVDFRGRAYVGDNEVSTCDFHLSHGTQNFGLTGGSGELGVETTPECAWSARTGASWIATAKGSTGKNTLRFSVAPNVGPPRAAIVSIGGQAFIVTQSGATREVISGPIRTNTGFQTSVIAACDDCSASSASLGFSLNFYGTTYTSVYVNNNGNMTFGSSSSTYTPTSFAGIGRPIIAAFWADVDTRGTGSGLTTYGTDTVNGHKAFGANWIDVGYFRQNVTKVNSFQLVLIERGDLGVGYFDIEMNYGSMLWETGDMSGGTNGLGGSSARAGFSNGTGTAGTYFELPGSAINGALIAGGGNSLSANTNSGIAGRYLYGVRAGSIVCGTGISPTSATVPAGGQQLTIDVTASNPACTWSVTGLPSWVHVTQPGSGNGSGSAQVKLQVDANVGAVRNVVIAIAGQSYGINQAGTTTLGTPLRFVPVTPCRIADTRNPNGAFGGPRIAGGTSRDFTIPSSACAIPASAAAYSLNVTVVPSASLAYLTIWPSGQPQPLVSTLNSFDARVKANAAIVPAGTGGAVSVYVTSATDVILDINGYFVPASGTSNLAFYPVTPCRIADTRNPTGALGGPIITGGTSRTFPVLQSSCGIPVGAQAYSLNMTAVPSGPLGYITTWPGGSSQPLVSTLNAPTGTVVANAAIVPSGTNGDISVYVSNSTHMVIDINGYFAAPAAGGLAFYTTTPCRICDTRNPAGAFGGPTIAAGNSRSFLVPQSGCNVPGAATAFSVNATVVPPAALGYLTLFPGGGNVPFVSTLNAFDGAITSNAAIVPVGANGALGAYVANNSDLILDINGYFAP